MCLAWRSMLLPWWFKILMQSQTSNVLLVHIFSLHDLKNINLWFWFGYIFSFVWENGLFSSNPYPENLKFCLPPEYFVRLCFCQGVLSWLLIYYGSHDPKSCPQVLNNCTLRVISINSRSYLRLTLWKSSLFSQLSLVALCDSMEIYTTKIAPSLFSYI